jgi:uncharacterized membrane protein
MDSSFSFFEKSFQSLKTEFFPHTVSLLKAGNSLFLEFRSHWAQRIKNIFLSTKSAVVAVICASVSLFVTIISLFAAFIQMGYLQYQHLFIISGIFAVICAIAGIYGFSSLKNVSQLILLSQSEVKDISDKLSAITREEFSKEKSQKDLH